MIIYITGASGSGKTTVLKLLPIKGYDLDDIYEANWKKHRKIETVQKGVKQDIDALVSKHPILVFVGLQGKEHLVFNPDHVILLYRTDYEQYFRQKLVRDLKLLCEGQKEYETILLKKPFDEFRNYFWSNDMVNMKTLDEFKTRVEKTNKAIQTDFPGAKSMTSSEIPKFIKTLSSLQ